MPTSQLSLLSKPHCSGQPVPSFISRALPQSVVFTDRKGNIMGRFRDLSKVTVHRKDLNLIQPTPLQLSTVHSPHYWTSHRGAALASVVSSPASLWFPQSSVSRGMFYNPHACFPPVLPAFLKLWAQSRMLASLLDLGTLSWGPTICALLTFFTSMKH